MRKRTLTDPTPKRGQRQNVPWVGSLQMVADTMLLPVLVGYETKNGFFRVKPFLPAAMTGGAVTRIAAAGTASDVAGNGAVATGSAGFDMGAMEMIMGMAVAL